MRWFIGGAVALLLVWTVYIVSPYWALVDLAGAVEARKVGRVADRVNFRAIRVELSKQVVAAAAASRPVANAIGSPDASLAAGSIAAAAEPLLEQFVTPEGLLSLLQDLGPSQAEPVQLVRRLKPDAEGFAALVELVRSARWRGFRNVYFTVRPDPKGPAARLQFRLSRLKWRLIGFELTAETRQRLLDELVRLQGDRSRR
jgi:hypothetical protein